MNFYCRAFDQDAIEFCKFALKTISSLFFYFTPFCLWHTSVIEIIDIYTILLILQFHLPCKTVLTDSWINNFDSVQFDSCMWISFYLSQRGNVFAGIPFIVCPWTGLHEKFSSNCRIMDYYYWKSPLKFRVDPTENGQMASILNFWWKCHLVNVNENDVGENKW